jgi:two-component system nitrogen regulation sensor histidine kinase NtrY
MKLGTKYVLFVGMVHGVALVLSYFVFTDNKVLFILAEAVILVSVFFSWQLYRELIRPLKLLTQGAEAIKDGDFTIKFRPTGKYEMDRLIEVYNRMIDELRTERTRQEQQHLFLEKLVFTSPTGILIMDYDGKIQHVNPRALELLGLDEGELLGTPLGDNVHPILREIGRLPLGQAKTVTFNGTATYKLQKSHFIDRGFSRHFVMIEELTAEILLAEKNTYGKVIRMMAHEVNNTIGPVNSILHSTLQSQTYSEMLTNALRVAIDRNNNLETFMRNFADLVRIPPPDKKLIDVVRLTKNVVDLMKLKAGEKKIVFRYALDSGPEVLMVHADVQQMEQVLINIIKNAMEAIEGEGVITVLFTHTHPAQLVIRDTGKGISPEMEQQLFSPFFSTKKDGQGVGLAVIKEILMNHRFDFHLRTVETGVTEFRIGFE